MKMRAAPAFSPPSPVGWRARALLAGLIRERAAASWSPSPFTDLARKLSGEPALTEGSAPVPAGGTDRAPKANLVSVAGPSERRVLDLPVDDLRACLASPLGRSDAPVESYLA